MASRQSTVDFIVEQTSGAGDVSAKKMFGDYGLFCDGKMVAIIGDDQLFVKPTAGGRAFVGEIEEVSPYPGAKPCFRIPEDKWEDRQWLSKLVKISAKELPLPKSKAKKTIALKRS